MRPRIAPLLALLVATIACDRRDRPRSVPARPADAPAGFLSPDATAPVACVRDPSFPSLFDVPEASAAAEVELTRGVRELLVVADSMRQGAALAYRIPDGPARRLVLPLDPRAIDDVEGMAWRMGHLYVLISTGYVERFTPDGKGDLTRDGDAYVLGAPPYVASIHGELTERPPDFEGLCLRAPAVSGAGRATPSAARCAGYAASRAYGWLVCLVFEGERLKVDPVHPRVPLDVPHHSLSDCAFGAVGGPGEGTLLVTTNIRGGSTVYRVDEGTGALARIDVEGTINDEAVAIDRDGRLYQFADAQVDHSPAVRATCTGW
jgi:hypothetical protein